MANPPNGQLEVLRRNEWNLADRSGEWTAGVEIRSPFRLHNTVSTETGSQAIGIPQYQRRSSPWFSWVPAFLLS
jgi:hypothetical protein